MRPWSHNHSFHSTALTAAHMGTHSKVKSKGLIKPTEKLVTNAGTTVSHAIQDHTLFLCIINRYRKVLKMEDSTYLN